MFISLKPRADALAEAAVLEKMGPEAKPLYGMVFAAKDNIDVAGLDTTAGCPAFAYRPAASATVIRRLEDAGAIVIGKTNLDQFATGLVGVRSPYGVPRNVLRPELIPGGSSSGSATAVAAGIVDFALGTDTAGSGRIPAGMNGIVGLKPSLGLLSSTGVVPACRTLDTVSVFARKVATAVEIASIAAAYDGADVYSRKLPVPMLAAVPPAFRVGVSPSRQRKFFRDVAAEAAYEADLAKLTAIGATLVELDFEPLLAAARLLYEGPWVAERYAAAKPLIEEHPEAFHPTTLKIIGSAKSLTAVETFEAMYKLADLRRAAAATIDAVDCLAVPTVPRMYTVAEVAADPIALNSNLGTYTNFLGGHERVVWRAANSAVQVWEDRCPHRGMRLSLGFIRGNALHCLYHGWEYSAASHCVRIPAHPDLEVPITIKAKAFPVSEAAGLIWTRMEGQELLPALPDARPLASLAVEASADAILMICNVVPRYTAQIFATELEGIRFQVGWHPVSADKSMLHASIVGEADSLVAIRA